MPTPAAVPWEDVLRQLTGLRLAIYDELLRKGALTAAVIAVEIDFKQPAELQIEQAIEWLKRHQLLRPIDGKLRAVPTAEARERWESAGEAVPDMPTPAEEQQSRPVVQAHQPEWFTLEGYRENKD